MPSPGSPELRLGPFSGHWYGLLVGLGAVSSASRARSSRAARREPWDVLLALPRGAAVRAGRRAAVPPRDGGSGAPERGASPSGVGGSGSSALSLGGGLALVVGAQDPRPRPGSRPRLRDARAGARTGDRPARELVQPGAVRRADRPAVGPRDRRRATARRACLLSHGRFQPPSRSRPSGTWGWRSSFWLLRRRRRPARGRARRVARRVRCGTVLDRGAPGGPRGARGTAAHEPGGRAGRSGCGRRPRGPCRPATAPGCPHRRKTGTRRFSASSSIRATTST